MYNNFAYLFNKCKQMSPVFQLGGGGPLFDATIKHTQVKHTRQTQQRHTQQRHTWKTHNSKTHHYSRKVRSNLCQIYKTITV